MPRDDTFDAIVIGTGFAGAVTACRLVEAGFRICVLERGRRYGADDFPRYPTEELFANDGDNPQSFAPPPDFSRWLWSQDHGIYDVRDLGDAFSVQAAGYGGGSLIYANVHLRPPYSVFDQGWPEPYKGRALQPYFDLAAYMLGVSPIPHQLAKTVQLQAAATRLGEPGAATTWFRAPLAVHFGGPPRFNRKQNPCDMRGRCWRGCDHRAKNTLDLNYLALAEDGNPEYPDRRPDIRTLAEVKAIRLNKCDGGKGRFTVTYVDLLLRDQGEGASTAKDGRCCDVHAEHEGPSTAKDGRACYVHAEHVFLCAGSVNTTELLFKCDHEKPEHQLRMPAPLGSHYFPNADSFSVVFDCDQPHEADYGPTITSALRYEHEGDDAFSYSIDFTNGNSDKNKPLPVAGMEVSADHVGTATLAHEPVLDWGTWNDGTAAGTLVLRGDNLPKFDRGDTLRIGEHATVKARSAIVRHDHWFLVEDGGYPPDLLPLVGVFRSPLWLRRNRYVEHGAVKSAASTGRAPLPHLRLQTFTDALAGSARGSAARQNTLTRSFDASRPIFLINDERRRRELLLPGLLDKPLGSIFPDWFVTALDNDRKQLIEGAAAFALPMLGRLLDELSSSVAKQIDPETRNSLVGGNVDGAKLQVLVRGMLRQALQILAGSEAAVAQKVANLIVNPVPSTPGQLLDLLGDLLLWALNYGTTNNHTGVLLTMGRDMYRGRLRFEPSPPNRAAFVDGRLVATLPNAILDTASATQERVLRDIAKGWKGELRTNPAWTALGKRVTVHSQGGCPMGISGESVTAADGQVHGIEGLYVMDAAAFPTSVGVNPSATIAAVAEYKIEAFIRRHSPDPDRLPDAHWSRTYKAAVETYKVAVDKWVKEQGRAAIDPLNHGGLGSNTKPSLRALGLTFKEEMKGFLADAAGTETPADWAKLDQFPARMPEFRTAENDGMRKGTEIERNLTVFRTAENDGMRAGTEIETNLTVTVPDLARLITPSGTEAAKSPVTGSVTLTNPSRCCRVIGDSFIQMFIRSATSDRPLRFFRYRLEFVDEAYGHRVLNALKVLYDTPGFDLWHDTATLYFEISGISGDGPLQRGILRVSIESFLEDQMRSVDICGTTDAARRSWALAAFYKYFASELTAVYMKRAGDLKDLFWKFLTSIHV